MIVMWIGMMYMSYWEHYYKRKMQDYKFGGGGGGGGGGSNGQMYEKCKKKGGGGVSKVPKKCNIFEKPLRYFPLSMSILNIFETCYLLMKLR